MNYKIKDLEEIFRLSGLRSLIEDEIELMQMEEEERDEWNILLLADSHLGRYQTQNLLELFTDLEISEEDFNDLDKNEIYHEALDYRVVPDIEDKLNEKFEDLLPEGYVLGVNYCDDVWLAIFKVQ